MTHKTALIVEDSQSVLQLLSMAFKLRGFDVLRASDGLMGMHVLADHKPDVILLDLVMPRMEGWTFCKECRAEGYAGPIVLVTGTDPGRSLDSMGVSALVEKPFDPDTVVDVAEAVLRDAALPADEDH